MANSVARERHAARGTPRIPSNFFTIAHAQTPATITGMMSPDFDPIRDELVRLFPDFPKALRPRAAFQWIADRTSAALRDQDLQAFLACLQIAQFIAELRDAKALEIGLASAWQQAWFFIASPSNHAAMISLVEKLRPEERAAVWLPCDRPHHWLRSKVLSIAEFSIASTIRASVERQETFIRQQSGPGQFARITLRFDEDRGSGAVNFHNRLPQEAEANLEYIEGIVDGLTQVIGELRAGGTDLTDLSIVLIALDHHAVDSKRYSFKIAAVAAFKFAVREAGLRPVGTR